MPTLTSFSFQQQISGGHLINDAITEAITDHLNVPLPAAHSDKCALQEIKLIQHVFVQFHVQFVVP